MVRGTADIGSSAPLLGSGMRLLTVRHVSTYRYSEPVELGEHWMMFRPRDSHDLRLVKTGLEIHPRPAKLRWMHDVFDNSLAVATFDGKTTELSFASRITLQHFEVPRPDYQLEPAAQFFPFAYSESDRANLERALVRRCLSDEIAQWAASFVDPSQPVETMALLRTMTQTIREKFTYSRRLERGVLTPDETLRRRSGSCRDFALLMIEAVRSLGLAARFVSGYIFVPEDNPSSTVGGGATHAWAQVYLPGVGWIDFDPTNNIIGNRNLIRVAVAWEPKDALPLWGTFVGSAASFIGLEVSVSVVEENEPDES
jgi:transglutaminase-like putative cysteine protease